MKRDCSPPVKGLRFYFRAKRRRSHSADRRSRHRVCPCRQGHALPHKTMAFKKAGLKSAYAPNCMHNYCIHKCSNFNGFLLLARFCHVKDASTDTDSGKRENKKNYACGNFFRMTQSMRRPSILPTVTLYPSHSIASPGRGKRPRSCRTRPAMVAKRPSG